MGARVWLVAGALVAAVTCPVGLVMAQGDPAGDRERLQREQAQQLQELARQQAQAGLQGFVVGVGADGMRQMRPIGPPDPEMVPAQMHLVGDRLYVIRGYMLYQFAIGDALADPVQVDLRTAEERNELPPQPPGRDMMMLRLPDPAAVPVDVQFTPDGGSLFVRRGYMLYHFAADGLAQLAEFDLRSEEERNHPRVRMRMMMGPAGPPGQGGPPPPPGEGPPPQ